MEYAKPHPGYDENDEAKLLRLHGTPVRRLREWRRIAYWLYSLDQLYANTDIDFDTEDDVQFAMTTPFRLVRIGGREAGKLPWIWCVPVPQSARELTRLRMLPDRHFPDYQGLTDTEGFRRRYHGERLARKEATQLPLFA